MPSRVTWWLPPGVPKTNLLVKVFRSFGYIYRYEKNIRFAFHINSRALLRAGFTQDLQLFNCFIFGFLLIIYLTVHIANKSY